MEDGKRGQCRDDSDCTPHTPYCSPQGYCSGGVQVKNVALNPNDIKTDAYYGKIEDDNRRGHVESRKEDPLFQEEHPELLPAVEAVENTVYEPCKFKLNVNYNYNVN